MIPALWGESTEGVNLSARQQEMTSRRTGTAWEETRRTGTAWGIDQEDRDSVGRDQEEMVSMGIDQEDRDSMGSRPGRMDKTS